MYGSKNLNAQAETNAYRLAAHPLRLRLGAPIWFYQTKPIGGSDSCATTIPRVFVANLLLRSYAYNTLPSVRLQQLLPTGHMLLGLGPNMCAHPRERLVIGSRRTGRD